MDLVKRMSSGKLFAGAKEKPRTVAPPPNAMAGLSRADSTKQNAIAEIRQEHDAMQLKTFTRWWNSWLSPRGTEVTELCSQVKNGVLGIMLMEALAGSVVSRYNRNPRNKYAELENQVTFINTIKSKGLTLVNIGPEDLQGGDKKLVLGLTWTLILRYEIQRYGADEMELLRWVKTVTTGYAGVSITTWSQSFCDGKAFSAILHAFHDKGIDYAAAAKLKPLKCLEQAFEIASNDPFKVAKLLDPQDLVGSALDTKSLITCASRRRIAAARAPLAQSPTPTLTPPRSLWRVRSQTWRSCVRRASLSLSRVLPRSRRRALLVWPRSAPESTRPRWSCSRPSRCRRLL